MTLQIQTFKPDGPPGEILKDWWLTLQNHRGDRAELRRARSPDDAALIPVTIDLVTRLRGTDISGHGGWIGRVPAIAGLAAHLNPNAPDAVLHDATPLAERMAAPKGDRPRVSELRFRRLLRTPRTELYRPMIRVLSLLDGRANLYELAESLFWWGPRIQREWAYLYFPKLPKTA